MAQQQMGLSLEEEDGELTLIQPDGDNYLRFRSIGAEAMLTEVFLCNDEDGQFFQRVLGRLMVRFQGDLHIRLMWNSPDRNSHGDFAEVKITRGAAMAEADSPLATNEMASGAAHIESTFGAQAPSSEPEDEIDALLERGRMFFERYQQLKRARS